MKAVLFLVFCVLFSCLGGCVPTQYEQTETAQATIAPEEGDAADGVLELEGRRYHYTGAEGDLVAENDVLTIRRGGVYRLRGTLQEGRLRINVDRDETVRLLLEGASITSSYGAPLEVEQGACVILETVGDSVNHLTDEKGSLTDTAAPRACVFSVCPLILRGTGSLIVSGRRANGIFSESNVILETGRVTVSARETAVLAEEFFLMTGGALTVTTATEGIVSSTAACDNCRRGRVEIQQGVVTVCCSEVAIRAGELLRISGGQGSLDAPTRYRGETVEVAEDFLKSPTGT